MFPTTSLLAAVSLALCVSTSPIVVRDSMITLPFTLNLNTTTTIAEIDRARAQHLQSFGLRKRATPQSFGVTNTAVTYTTSVGVGTPATQYTLLIDTGSSNTWVGASKAYKKTSSSIDTGSTVSVSYGSGSFSGEEYLDTVTLSPGLVIKNQSIGVATQSEGFNGIDGILGVGPADLTLRTQSNKVATVPTVTNNLFGQGTIPSNSIGISYNPTSRTPSTNGELTFGGADSSKYTGAINYVPITRMGPSSSYWGVDQSVSYGPKQILATTAGIVDTGTTLVMLATDAYRKYNVATDSDLDKKTGLLMLPASSYNKLQNLTFTIGKQNYVLTPNAQIWPRSLNAGIGGTSDNIYLIVSDLGSKSGQGLDFINGYTFLERFYTVFDTGNRRVGFATTANTNAEIN